MNNLHALACCLSGIIANVDSSQSLNSKSTKTSKWSIAALRVGYLIFHVSHTLAHVQLQSGQ